MIEAVCFDLGDTLVAEETVIHDSSGQAIIADATEGAFKVLEAIRKDGRKVALVANADSISARNIVKATGLEGYFDAVIISEEVGIEKPGRRIFEIAFVKLGVKAEKAVREVMPGNYSETEANSRQ